MGRIGGKRMANKKATAEMQIIRDSFAEIVGYEDVKKEMYEYCDVLRNPDKYKKMGVYQPHGLLIHGEPGIGKSLMAACVIKASGRKSYEIRKDKPDGDLVKYIQETFATAKENVPSIILIDDMDKFANEDYDHRNAEEYVAIQACIDSVRGKNVFVIATVNDFDILPESLKRTGRFDRIIELSRPEKEDAVEIIKYHLSNKKCLSEIDIDEVAAILGGSNCADLESIINEAGIYAGFAGKECIDKEDIIRAYLRLVFQAPERNSNEDYEQDRIVAMHEAGHAIVAEVLDPGSVKVVSICRHIGSTEGITSVYKPNYFKASHEKTEVQILVALGGRAAIELHTGEIDLGAEKDLERAQKMIERMHAKNAAYDFISLSARRYMDAELQRDDRARFVSYDMRRYYDRVKQILIQNKELFESLVELLLEKKTLTYKDIGELFTGKNLAS